jgi:hypothetical protein
MAAQELTQLLTLPWVNGIQRTLSQRVFLTSLADILASVCRFPSGFPPIAFYIHLLSSNHRFIASENKMFLRMLGPKRKEMSVGQRRLGSRILRIYRSALQQILQGRSNEEEWGWGNILWCMGPLMGRDLETYEYSHCYAIGVSKQRLGKHVLAETIPNLSLGNCHDHHRRIVGGNVFCWVRPEVV